MSKSSFKQEISDYLRNGGNLSFSFGDIILPVIYRESLNLLCVKMPSAEVFISVDYGLDFSDNANILMEKLLQNYPELSD